MLTKKHLAVAARLESPICARANPISVVTR